MRPPRPPYLAWGVWAALAGWVPRAHGGTPPDREVARWELGTEVSDVAWSDTGRWLVALESGGAAVHVVDGWTWQDTVVAVCADPSGVAIDDEDGGAIIAVGCADGTVARVDVAPDGTATRGDSWRGGVSGSVVAVAWTDTQLLAVARPASGSAQVHAWGRTDGAPVTSGYPSTLSSSSVAGTAVAGSMLFVVHGSDLVSKVDLRTGAASRTRENLGSRDFVDAWAWNAGTVYLADSGGSLCVLNAGGNDLAILRDDVAPSVNAVVGEPEEGWMLLATDSDVRVLAFSGGPGEQVGVLAGVEGVHALASHGAYAVGGATGGTLSVLTSLPWVTLEPLEEGVRDVGDTVPLAFTVDRGGRWRVRTGGTPEDPGPIAAEGRAEAGVSVPVELAVDDTFVEGVNLVWVEADGDAGTGRAAVKVQVDRAPPAVRLPADGVGFGDGRVVVRVEAPDVADLARITLYLSTVPFVASDWPAGGPTPDVPGGLSPVVREARPGEDLVFEVDGLTNDVSVHVGLRATDAGGREGPLSTVRVTTPAATLGAAARAGDPGSQCGAVGSGRDGGALTLLALAAMLGRRRGVRVLGRGVPPPATPPGGGA
ncbi:MAG: hypothetical protein RLZZ299_1939 [Pseudomonadota bacterium]